ncbi:squalene--hopene cyclase [Sinomonas terrae]|uniref:Squalene--hopene cyclase n=1 Tax=Sinomonas terrae TaxID=2908838 RepID=A0ABS9U4N2_9MICC|nr:squalene--hopene cyclase [Sinomonas terrae]MCH6471646.1 squalene--hopene cyclase [Sinomonas terrae]
MTTIDRNASASLWRPAPAPPPAAAPAPAPAPAPADDAAAQACLDAAVQHLLGLQEEGGWWQGELETNVTMDAEDLLMRQFLGVRTPEQTAQSARWIRSQQRGDGSWANFYGGPADPSTTAEAYVALRLAGDAPEERHMRLARDVVLAHGGLERTRVFTRIWLALFGAWSWDEVPALPPELIFLPPRVPLNLYDFACWARQTIAPLTVLAALRPQAELGFGIDELRAGAAAAGVATETPARAPSPAARAFDLLDSVLHRYETIRQRHQRFPGQGARATALRRTVEWIVDRQEADGSWGGIQPPWVYSLMALRAYGYSLDDPVLVRGLGGWNRFTITEETAAGPMRRIEACQSPVWDTALALTALADAGLPSGHPSLERAADWICGEEIRVRGDWAVRRPHVPAGGWAFEFDNDGYPDIDDAAEVIMGLDCVRPTPERGSAASRGRDWILGMQSRDGGWAAFDVDNTRELAYQLPFCDFGAVIDPPSADVTAHVVEMLARRGENGPALTRGVRWLLEHQEADGSWFGRWGANYVYGTGAVVPALTLAGLPSDSSPVRRAVQWLWAHQNDDGGWGEDLRSYKDTGWAGRGESTASQTAWALLALDAANEADGNAARRGVDWLVSHQRPDGSWDEPQFTGTGFPGDFYINYHLYRLVFPVSALGRCLRRSRR